MSRLTELRQKRAALISEGRKILDACKEDSLSADDQARYDTILADSEKIGETVQQEERQLEMERSAAERTAAIIDPKADSKDEAEERQAKIMEGFTGFLKGTGTNEEFRNFQEESRALSAGLDTEGGYLITPEVVIKQLIQAVDDAVVVRQLATKFQTNGAASLGVPSLDTDIADAAWTTELQTGTEDSSMAFGKRKLTPHAFAKRIKVSNELLNSDAMNPVALVMARMAYKFALTEEKGFLTGTGFGQPLGLFTASAQGISTGQDISTGNTTTSIKFDGLQEAKYGIKSQYANVASWLFNRAAVKQIAKLKDGEGQYIWQPSVVAGQPDTLLARPVIMSENAPSTFTTGLYVGMFGDFSNYWIADSMTLAIQRLNELYAEANQVGFIGRAAADGMPVLEEAFARITLA